MEAGRQLIRYVLPGGYALLVAAVYEEVFSWAWGIPVHEIISTAKSSPVTTIGGAVIIGFVIYQLYYAFYRPVIPLPLRVRLPGWMRAWVRRLLPSWASRRLSSWARKVFQHRFWILTLGAVYTSDLGGAGLKGLAEVPWASEALKLPDSGDAAARVMEVHGVHGATQDLAEWEWSKQAMPRTAAGRRYYTRILNQREQLFRMLLDLADDTGQPQIRRSYSELADIYHVLGACRAALISITAAAAVDIATKHAHEFSEHIVRSLGVAGVMLLLLVGSWYVIKVNRRDTWRTMTAQVASDLRIWGVRHAPLLEAIAAGQAGVGRPERAGAQVPFAGSEEPGQAEELRASKSAVL